MRICIVPEYPDSLMTGGVQVQATETCRALIKAGIDAELFTWSGRHSLPDVYHFIGFPQYLCRLAELVKDADKPYVCTVLGGCVRNPWRIRIAGVVGVIKGMVFPARRQYCRALQCASAVVAITVADRIALRQVYRIPVERLFVVPNGVDEVFRVALPDLWHRVHGKEPFALCVGAVQPRKNQLLLLCICNELRIPVVLLGPILPGETAYARRVAEAVKTNAQYGGKWLQCLAQDDPLLISAFAACKAFILLSQSETQPLSVLQAMAVRKPILLAEASYAMEHPFAGLVKTGCMNHRQLLESIRKIWEAGRETELPLEFSWDDVAHSLLRVYQRVLAGRERASPETSLPSPQAVQR